MKRGNGRRMATGLDALREHLVRESSGELIGATGLVEVHAWLQRGRLAWATTSRSRRTFRQYLSTVCGVSDARLGELFSSCRAERRPLGEGLVESGVATREQVEAGLRQQLATALIDLATLDATQVVLLPRQWETSEHTLTFSLEDLLRPSTAPTPGPFPLKPPSAGLLSQLTRQLPMLQWCVHTDGVAISAEAPSGCAHAAADVPNLHRASFVEGADVLVLRRPDDLIIGAQNAHGSAWGALSLAGPVVRALAAFTAGTLARLHEPLLLGDGLVREGDALEPALLTERECLAIIASHDRSVLARTGLDVDRLRRMTAAFAVLVSLLPNAAEVALRAWPGWWFGANTGKNGAMLWLVMESQASSSPGLAWARLRAMGRQLRV